MKFHVLRSDQSAEGTFGSLLPLAGAFPHPVYTGELPWRDNHSDVSCIPGGIYQCRMTLSPHFGYKTYEIMDVPGRVGERIHSGNFCGDKSKGFKSDVLGCILLGFQIGELEGQKAILQSKDARAWFEAFTQGQQFELEIGYL